MRLLSTVYFVSLLDIFGRINYFCREFFKFIKIKIERSNR